MIVLYHGSDYLFNKFIFKNVGKKSGTGGAGFGIYLTTSKADALAYGKYVYTINAQLQKGLSNEKKTLSVTQFRTILQAFEELSENSYTEAFGENALVSHAAQECYKNNKTDVDMIGDVINATGDALTMMKVLVKYGYTHAVDNVTPEDKTTTNYVLYDLNAVRIVKREKPIDDLTESVISQYIEEYEEIDDLKESMETRIVVDGNVPEPLVSLSDNMSREARTRTLDQAAGRAKSKSQRRLMAMALAYKRGKLPAKYASDTIKKLSKSIGQDTLHDFAKTNQKKRRKDGSVGKRNNIPYKVKK